MSAADAGLAAIAARGSQETLLHQMCLADDGDRETPAAWPAEWP
jgi:hypothetical protein